MSEREEIASPNLHTTSLAVWDFASPVVAGRRATLKVGIACSSGCDLTGTRIDVYDEAGARVGGGSLGSAPWPATIALYWAELEVAAPEAEGGHSWSLQATAPLDQARGALSDSRKASEPSHGHATSMVRFVASRPPEHRVTLEVIDRGSAVPLTGVELRLGRFRATTNEAGIARVEVPGGTYEVCAWKIGYDVLSSTAHVTGDTTIRLEVAVAPEPEQPYWM
jgi:hypothetical protein